MFSLSHFITPICLIFLSTFFNLSILPNLMISTISQLLFAQHGEEGRLCLLKISKIPYVPSSPLEGCLSQAWRKLQASLCPPG